MNPRIYVGTYAKYNNGNLFGEWLEPADYENRDDFYAACRELHSDETCPEFMFQDWEDIPQCLIKESYVCDSLWDWVYMDEPDLTTVAVYWDEVDSSASAEYALEHLLGTADIGFNTLDKAKEEWLYSYLEDTCFFDGWSEVSKNYFDLSAYLRDCEIDGMTFVKRDGVLYVFSSI
jgi:antirestriction protein